MVYGSGLENRQAERPRGFESHPLRPASRPRASQDELDFARSRMSSEALAKEGKCITSILSKVALHAVNAMWD